MFFSVIPVKTNFYTVKKKEKLKLHTLFENP